MQNDHMKTQAGGVPRHYRLAERIALLSGLVILVLGVVLPGFFGFPQALFVVCLFAGIMLVMSTAAIHGRGLQAEVLERVRLEYPDVDVSPDQPRAQ